MDEHARAKAEGKGEKEAPVIWDHDRDMGITGRLLSDHERHAKIRCVGSPAARESVFADGQEAARRGG